MATKGVKMKRTPKTERVTARVSRSSKMSLVAEAYRLGLTESGMVQRVLDERYSKKGGRKCGS